MCRTRLIRRWDSRRGPRVAANSDLQGGACTWQKLGENVDDGISGTELGGIWTAWTGSAAVIVRGVLGRGFL